MFCRGNISYFESLRVIYNILSSRVPYGHLRILSKSYCKRNVEESSASSQAFHNVVRNLQKKIQHSVSAKNSVRKSIIGNIYFQKESENSPKRFPKPFLENFECDNQIKELIRNHNSLRAVDDLKAFAIQNKYPSRKTMLVLAKICASKGALEGIQSIRDISEIAFPAENAWQMGYMHYEAEALWRKGDFEKSLKIFEELFLKYPLQRRKLTNMLTFYMRGVINDKISMQYSNLVAFVNKCIHMKEYVPASNLWRVAFCSECVEVQGIAENLLANNKELLNFIVMKFQAIIDEAQALKRADILQRLIHLALKEKLVNYYSSVFAGYVNYICK